MPKFGVDVTNIAPAQVKPFIAPGVETQQPTINAGVARAKMIGELGGMAVEAYKGYQLADIEQAQEENIAAYQSSFKSKQDKETAVDQAKFELGASEQVINAAWGIGDKQPVATLETISELENNQQQALTKLQNAYKQGVMTPAEFHARVLNTTREAVAKNPGLYPELIGHAQKVMDLSGITEIVKSDQKRVEDQAKELAKYRESVYSTARQLNIPHTYDTPFASLEAEVNIRREEEQLVQRAENAKKFHTSMAAKDSYAWAEANGDKVSNGARSQFELAVSQAAASVETPTDAAGFLHMIRGMANGAKENFRSMIPENIRSEQLIKDKLEFFDRTIDSVVKNVESYKTKEDIAKAITNGLNITRAQQELEVRGEVNVFAAEAAARIMQASPGTFQNLKQEERKNLLSTFAKLLDGQATAPNVVGKLPKTQQDKQLVQPLSATIDAKDWNAFGRIMDTYQAIPGISREKQLHAYNTLESIAKGDFTGAGQDVFVKTKNVIDSYLKNPEYGLPRMFPFIKDNPVVLDVLPNGMLSATGQGATEFNETFGIKINTALQAYAKSANMSTKEVSGNFYKEYFSPYADAQGLLTDPDIGKSTISELAIHDSNEAKVALDQGRISAQEYRAILKDMKIPEQEIEASLKPPEYLLKAIEGQKNLPENLTPEQRGGTAIHEASSKMINDAATALIEAGAPIVEAYGEALTYIKQGITNLAEIERDYRARVRGEGKYKKEKKKELIKTKFNPYTGQFE